MKAWRIARLAAPLGIMACAVAVATTAGAQARRDSLTLYEYPDYRGASVTFYGDAPQVGSTGFADRAQSAQVIGTWRVCSGGGFRNRCEVLTGNVRNLSSFGLSRQVGSAQRLSDQAAAPLPAPRYEGPTPYTPPPVSYPPAAEVYPLSPARPYPGYQPPYAGAGAPYDGPYSDARPGYGSETYPSYSDYSAPALDAPGGAYAQDYGAYGGGTAPGLELFNGQSSVFFPRPHIGGVEVSATGVRAADGFCRNQGLGVSLYFDASRRSGRSMGPDGRMMGPGPVLSDVLCRRS
jgi:hypothetical protein